MARLLGILLLLALAVAFHTPARAVSSCLLYDTDYNVTLPVDTPKPNTGKKGKILLTDSLLINSTDSLRPILQADSIPLDSTRSVLDTIRPLTLDEMMYQVSADSFDADVQYNATDSLIYDIGDEKVHLYGNAVVIYKDLTLEADYIQLDWANNMVIAESKKDSLGNPIEKAKFKDAENEYYAKTIMYNFKTKKGKVIEARTQEGEGYIHADTIKRNEYEEWYAKGGKYTTCDLDHPHFYISAKKMKLVPDKVIVSGPANLVVHDIPTPLFAPFGIFPIQKNRRSGIILPQYGAEQNRGFFFRDGGYYFHISDYLDMALTGSIYTNGSWGLSNTTRYSKRYKYNGNLLLAYNRNRTGDVEAPTFNVINDFRVTWSHRQDSKARPGSIFSAQANLGTATFDKNTNNTNQSQVLRNTLNSNVSYSKSWIGKPLTFSVNLRHDQNLLNRTVTLQLPDINFAVTTISPFQRKIPLAKKAWYETITVGYNVNLRNSIEATDTNFLTLNTIENMKSGMKHYIPISSNFRVFKYFTVNPRFNYNEVWYVKNVEKQWDPTTRIVSINDSLTDTIYGQIVADTFYKFKPARDFNFQTAVTTKLFGMIQFKNSKLKAIRHVMTPSLTFTYRPDFSSARWGYYKNVQTNQEGAIQRYSIYEPVQGLFGSPPVGKQASLGLSITNNLEMKTFSAKDTLKNERKIKLIDNFTVSTSYNFAADSLNLAPLGMNMNTTLFDKINVNFNTVLDPYVYDERNVRVDRFLLDDRGKLMQLRSFNFTVGSSFRSRQGTGTTPNVKEGREQERDIIMANYQNYYDFNVPWSFTFNYNFGMTRGGYNNPDTLLISSNSLNVGLDITLTEKWKVDVQSSYDFSQNKLVYASMNVIRDMHCWVLRFTWVPYPLERQTYAIELNVKSQVLQELKLSRKKNVFDSAF
ncbi:putative LPS assembly protein LptD [soil metagenome]